MEFGGFEFNVEELEGCRLVEVTYPPVVDISTLSVVIARYYDMWDDDAPTLSLVNLSLLVDLTPELRQIIKSVIQRTVLQPSFVAAAWYTGDNRRVFDEIRQVRKDAGRPTDDVYETRDEAIEFLRAAIRAWRVVTRDPRRTTTLRPRRSRPAPFATC
jgi:hypothetical protein